MSQGTFGVPRGRGGDFPTQGPAGGGGFFRPSSGWVKLQWLTNELTSKRPLLGLGDFAGSDMVRHPPREKERERARDRERETERQAGRRRGTGPCQSLEVLPPCCSTQHGGSTSHPSPHRADERTHLKAPPARAGRLRWLRHGELNLETCFTSGVSITHRINSNVVNTAFINSNLLIIDYFPNTRP